MLGTTSLQPSISGLSGGHVNNDNNSIQSLVQPNPQPATDLDPTTLAEIAKSVRIFNGIMKPSKQSSKQRNFFAWTVGLSGTSLAASRGSKSSTNVAAASNVFHDVSREIDRVLQDVGTTTQDEITFARYRQNVEMIKNHRFSTEDLQKFEGTQDDWRLIRAAVTAADSAYNDAHEPGVEIFKISRSQKFTIMFRQQIGSKRVLVVAVRGSVTLEDWCLNFNSAPKLAPKLLDGETAWHGGFLSIAETMEEVIAKSILENIARGEPVDELLLCGHSAGGAVAQLFYAMTMASNRALSRATASFNRIHCITIGAPPVGSVAIHTHAHPKTGSFWSIINEGDPVPQAQEEFIKKLIAIYLCPTREINARYPQGVELPRGHYRASGNPLVLLDDPEDIHGVEYEAHTTTSGALEKMLFGNPFLHLRSEYMDRVRALTETILANDEVDEVGSSTVIIQT